jgi:hypothetical protein
MLRRMMMAVAAPPPPAGFWGAISATSPEVWLKLNEAGGSVATNSGTGAAGTYNGTISFSQGSLCSTQVGADSIRTVSSPTGYVTAPTSSGSLSCVIGICYAGTGESTTGVCVLWRTIFSNINGAYLRIDQTNITVQPRASVGGLDTGVASSVLKDGNPHLILVGNLAESPTTLRMWIDGTLVWTYGGSQTMELNGTLVVGRNGNSAQYSLGRFADAFLSTTATTAQVSSINSSWAP